MTNFESFKNYIINNENSAVVILLYFLVMLAFTFLCRKYFWKLVCKAADRTVDEVAEKKKEIIKTSVGLSSSINGAKLEIFLQSLAPNPNAVLILDRIHSICLLPIGVSIIVSVVNLFNPNAAKFIPVLAIIDPCVCIALLIAAKAGMKHEFKYVERKNDRTAFYYPSIILQIIIAIIFCIGGFRIAKTGIDMYNEQVEQSKWTKTTATVFAMEKDYDIYKYTYKYTVDGKEYLNYDYLKYEKYTDVTTIDIRYNPENFEESTTQIEPHLPILTVNVAAGILFAGIGISQLFVKRIYNALKKKKEKQKSC